MFTALHDERTVEKPYTLMMGSLVYLSLEGLGWGSCVPLIILLLILIAWCRMYIKNDFFAREEDMRFTMVIVLFYTQH